MKRSEMVEVLDKAIEEFKMEDGHFCSFLLKALEKAGMEPPKIVIERKHEIFGHGMGTEYDVYANKWEKE